MKRFFSKEDIGSIGSYASLFGFLLIATILAYREIFDFIVDLAQNRIQGATVNLLFVLMMVIFGLIFVIIPTIPIISDIIVDFKNKNRRMAWMLIFMVLVYDFALFFQLIHYYVDKFGS